MQLITWNNFVKKSNSTRQPVGIAGVNHEVRLKQGTDMTNPTFLLDEINWNITYCMWNNRYYFVTGKRVGSTNVFELQCSLDHMATFKSNIGGSTAYIKYASTGYNTKIVDNRFSTLTDENITYGKNESHGKPVELFDFSVFNPNNIPYLDGINKGTFLLQCIASSEDTGTEVLFNTGGVVTYAMDFVTFYTLSNKLLKFPEQEGTFERLKALVGSFRECIIGVKWVPISFHSYLGLYQRGGSFTSKLWIGEYEKELPNVAIIYDGTHEYQAPLYRVIVNPNDDFYLASVPGSQIDTLYKIDIPFQFNDWRNLPPYTEATLYLPFYGTVPIELNNYIGNVEPQINIAYTFDFITGDLTYKLLNPAGRDLDPDVSRYSALYKCNIAYNIPLTAITDDPSAYLHTAIGVASTSRDTMNQKGFYGKFSHLGDVAASTLDFYIASNSRSITQYGSLDSIKSIKSETKYPYITLTYHNTNIEPLSIASVWGIPVEKQDVIGNYSGYIQCVNASIDGNMMDSERQTVNNFLNGGFYYE